MNDALTLARLVLPVLASAPPRPQHPFHRLPVLTVNPPSWVAAEVFPGTTSKRAVCGLLE